MQYSDLSKKLYTDEAFIKWFNAQTEGNKELIIGFSSIDSLLYRKLLNLCVSKLVKVSDLSAIGSSEAEIATFIDMVATKYHMIGVVSSSQTHREYLALKLGEILPKTVSDPDTVTLVSAKWATSRRYEDWKPLITQSSFEELFNDRLMEEVYAETGLAEQNLLLSDVFSSAATIWATESPFVKSVYFGAYSLIFGEFLPYLSSTKLWNLYFSSDIDLSPVNRNLEKTANLLNFAFPTSSIATAIGECSGIMRDSGDEAIVSGNNSSLAIIEKMLAEKFELNHPLCLNRFALMSYVLGIGDAEWITAWEKLESRITIFATIIDVLRNNISIMQAV